MLALVALGGLTGPAMAAGARAEFDGYQNQTGHGDRGRDNGRGRGHDRDRGCEKPSYRRGHSRGGSFIYTRPGVRIIIVRPSDGCNQRDIRRACR